jgi:hypothetical protein
MPAVLPQAVGHQLVLSAVNGSAIDDPHGMGQFRAGLEAVKAAGRPIVLRLLLQAPPAQPEPEPEPELEPEPETEPELAGYPAAVDEAAEDVSKVKIGDRGAVATRKTRNALLGGLRSGTLEGACGGGGERGGHLLCGPLALVCAGFPSLVCALLVANLIVCLLYSIIMIILSWCRHRGRLEDGG